jgi:adenosine/AMP kinase
MPTERELFQDLFQACRQLLRYDGIDKERVRQAVDNIRDIVSEYLYLQENSESDTG